MNHMRATISVVVDHSGLTDEQLRKLLEKIAKASIGRSQRECSVECGGVVVSKP